MDPLLLISILLLYCTLLASHGIASDRSAWVVVALFVAVDLSLYLLLPDNWGPFESCVEEFYCMEALILHAWTPMGRKLLLTIGGFWVAHLCLYSDVKWGTTLIYEHYETVILGLVAVIFTLGANGVVDIIERLGDRVQATDFFGCDADHHGLLNQSHAEREATSQTTKR